CTSRAPATWRCCRRWPVMSRCGRRMRKHCKSVIYGTNLAICTSCWAELLGWDGDLRYDRFCLVEVSITNDIVLSTGPGSGFARCSPAWPFSSLFPLPDHEKWLAAYASGGAGPSLLRRADYSGDYFALDPVAAVVFAWRADGGRSVFALPGVAGVSLPARAQAGRG